MADPTTNPERLLCRTARMVRVALAKGGDVVLCIETTDGTWYNYAFSPSQIQGISADFEKALNFPTEAGCTSEK